MCISVKNIFFTLITLLIFFFISEIIGTTFFYFKTGYSGPLLRVIKSSDSIEQGIILESIRIDIKTNKMVPGNYIINEKKYHTQHILFLDKFIYFIKSSEFFLIVTFSILSI